MHAVTVLALAFLMCGCARAEITRLITPENTGWIQKGVTTRSEIEARFGSPSFEVPEYTGSTAAAHAPPRNDNYNPSRTSAHVESPQDTKATYLQARPQTEQDRFWVTYDENNVVEDSGFTGSRIARPAPSTNAQP